MALFDSVLDTVGSTPLVRLRRIGVPGGATLLAKLESRNPSASVKDRVGVAMLRDAEARGILRPGSTIVEPTSGNTGVALAMAAAALGYRLVITMPETMSKERVKLLELFGAEVVLTAGSLMRGAVERAEELARSIPGAILLQQFQNPSNPDVHYRTTAHEIWEDTDGALDGVVAGVGTGGTVTGIGRFLKERSAAIRVFAVEPAASAVLSGNPAGPHYIQGIGAGFVPAIFDRRVVDEVIPVADTDALEMARRLARDEGILAGISAGAAMAAAVQLAARPDLRGKRLVVILPDSGERYLSSL